MKNINPLKRKNRAEEKSYRYSDNPPGSMVFLKLKDADGTQILGKLSGFSNNDDGEKTKISLTQAERKYIIVQDPLKLHYGYSDEYDSNVVFFSKYPYFDSSFNVVLPLDSIQYKSFTPIKEMVNLYKISLKKIKKSWVPLLNKEFKTAIKKIESLERIEEDVLKYKNENEEKEYLKFITSNKSKSVH